MRVFGSAARGEQKKESDIDIIVEFNSPIGFFDFIRLEKSLSKILQKRVDLVSKKAIKSAIKDQVLKKVINYILWATIRNDLPYFKEQILELMGS